MLRLAPFLPVPIPSLIGEEQPTSECGGPMVRSPLT